MNDPVALLRELVQCHSPSGQEDAAVACLKSNWDALGFSSVQTGRNLHTFMGEGDKTLLLNSHTDTVPVGEGWSVPALEAFEKDGRIYGRGSNDAKGCLSAMTIGAYRAFNTNPPKGRVCLAATCEEETSGKGLEVLIKDLPKFSAAVVGEPTGLAPAVAQKGLLLLNIVSKGRSAHAAWGGGINALTLAAKDILALDDFKFSKKHSVLGYPSLAVTQAKGGERHNVIPDLATLTVDVRTTPVYSPEEIVSLVRDHVKGDVSVRSSRLQSVDTPLDHDIVKAAIKANPNSVPFGSPTLSDWVFLKGIPTVKVGPGDSTRSHTPDEYVYASEILEGASYYERLIREYFSS